MPISSSNTTIVPLTPTPEPGTPLVEQAIVITMALLNTACCFVPGVVFLRLFRSATNSEWPVDENFVEEEE